jgi:hypothetical protein
VASKDEAVIVLVHAPQPTAVMTLDSDALPTLAPTQLRPLFAPLSKRAVAALGEPSVSVRPELDEAIERSRRKHWRKAAHLTLTDRDPTVRIAGTEGGSVDRATGGGRIAQRRKRQDDGNQPSIHRLQKV